MEERKKLEEKIEQDFKSALKGRETTRLSTLRLLKAAINNEKISKNKNILEDEDVLKLIQKQVKQRRESIEQFEKGNRHDLANKEKEELNILLSYLPEQLTDKELEEIAKEIIKELNASARKDMGKVMKVLMGKVKGRADGRRASEIVSKLLS